MRPFLSLISLFISWNAVGSVLPYSYKLVEESLWSRQLDSGFERWIQSWEPVDPISRYKPSELSTILQGHDEPTRALLLLAYAQKKFPSQKVVAAAHSALAVIKDKTHPLAPYILERASSVLSQDLSEDILRADVHSCPARRALVSRFSDASMAKRRPESYRKLFAIASSLESADLLSEILDEGLSQAQKSASLEAYRSEVVDLFSPHPDLFERVQIELTSLDLEKSTGAKLRHQLSKKRCFYAKRDLERALRAKTSEVPMDSAIEWGQGVARCYRRKSLKRAVNVWRSLLSFLKYRYGDAGYHAGQIQLARLYWVADRYDKANKIAKDLVSYAREHEQDMLLAEGLEIASRIAMSQDRLEDAAKYQRDFAERFPQHEDVEDILRELTIASVGLKRWADVERYAKELVRHQTKLPFDDRDMAMYGFGLFWRGRALVAQNKKEEGLRYWKRLVTECFSTFYGALGHYMLEQQSGKQYVVQPLVNNTFEPNQLMTPFSKPERRIVERAIVLAKLGFNRDSHCELAGIQPGHVERAKLTKALLLHVNGEWLDSIIAYGGINRSFRSGLPYGMERLLFPKKYESLVETYAKKLGLDPDLVFSVIRQESVFNRHALSHAGARGLMQLMTFLARSEVKRLKKGYVTARDKRRLKRKVRNKRTLYDPETSIIIGTHYLNRLLATQGNVVLALASYNAGPTVVRKWTKKIESSDPLYFIERIPYQETRGYVKLILRNYFYYKKWYRAPKDPPVYLGNLLQGSSPKIQAAR